jgi:sugar phosphate permease
VSDPAAEHSNAPAPHIARRALISRLVTLGKRWGYGLFFIAMVLFFVGFVVGFTTPVTTVITICLVIGSLILAPAIVFHYGVRAAQREEAGIPRRH